MTKLDINTADYLLAILSAMSDAGCTSDQIYGALSLLVDREREQQYQALKSRLPEMM